MVSTTAENMTAVQNKHDANVVTQSQTLATTKHIKKTTESDSCVELKMNDVDNVDTNKSIITAVRPRQEEEEEHTNSAKKRKIRENIQMRTECSSSSPATESNNNINNS
eukprot:10769928-Ditylum_brightwellii.AAC.1